MQIHQRVAGGDRDLRLDRSQRHRDAIVGGQRGTNFHQARKPSEAIARDGHLVGANGQTPDDRHAVGIRGQGLMHLLRLADELDRAHQRQAAAVGDHEAQLAGVGRAELGQGQGDQVNGHTLKTLLLLKLSMSCRVLSSSDRRQA